jgi:hypothetical protein
MTIISKHKRPSVKKMMKDAMKTLPMVALNRNELILIQMRRQADAERAKAVKEAVKAIAEALLELIAYSRRHKIPFLKPKAKVAKPKAKVAKPKAKVAKPKVQN